MVDESRPIRIMCCGEIGRMFIEQFGEKLKMDPIPDILSEPRLPRKIHCDFVENISEIEKSVRKSDSSEDEELFILIAEYDERTCGHLQITEKIKNLLDGTIIKFLIVHPINDMVSECEQAFVDQLCQNYGSGRIVLGMPDLERKEALRLLCSVMFDMIRGTFKSGYIQLEYNDLTLPCENREKRYGRVYHVSGMHCGQIVEMTKSLLAQVKGHPKGMVQCFYSQSGEVSLMNIAESASMVDEALAADEYGYFVYSYVIVNEDPAISLVLYCD